MESQSEFIYKDGKFYRRESTVIEIGPLTEITSKAKQVGFTIIPDCFKLEMPSKQDYENNTSEKMVSVNVHVARNNRQMYVCHRLVYYPLYGRVVTADRETDLKKGKQKIHWHGERGEKVRLGVDYPGLWMIYAFSLSNHRISGFQQLYFTTNIKGNHYAPCFPNIHNNGNVCMGQVRANFEGDVQKTVQNLYNEYHMSESNDHLMDERMKSVLKFDYTKDDKIESKWTPPDDFYKKPAAYHANRKTTIAAELLVDLVKIEERDFSQKVGVA